MDNVNHLCDTKIVISIKQATAEFKAEEWCLHAGSALIRHLVGD